MAIERWVIAAARGTIEGEGPIRALEIKRSSEAPWEWVPDEIEGYKHREGESAEIEVEITPVANPPADASSLHYKCVRTIRRGGAKDRAGRGTASPRPAQAEAAGTGRIAPGRGARTAEPRAGRLPGRRSGQR